jgi:hypothetical protein
MTGDLSRGSCSVALEFRSLDGHTALIGQRIVNRHADLGDIVADRFGGLVKQVMLENLPRFPE